VIIRIFTCRAVAGRADELGAMLRDISVPFVDGHAGLVARFSGGPVGANADEFVMLSVWRDLDALTGMTGQDWQAPVIPDDRERELMAEMTVQHYKAIA
jgi:hypothetical protein